jgi:hypothetical protein
LRQQAVGLIPDGDSKKQTYLTNLGCSFLARFEASDEIADIDKAIMVLQDAVDSTANEHADKVRNLSNLGFSFRTRFVKFVKAEDIDEAILLQQQAVNLTPDNHFNKAVYLKNLGDSFQHRYMSTSSTHDLRAAVRCFCSSAMSIYGSPRQRLSAACSWALHASLTDYPPHEVYLSPLQASHVIMNLIPRVVWLGNPIILRYQDIAEVGKAVNLTASIACRTGRPDLALEWLEQGRSIVWGQILHLRTPLDELQHDHPDLAASLESIACQLDILASSSASPYSSDCASLSTAKEPEMNAQRHRRLIEEWEATLHGVRQSPRHKSFLLPKEPKELAPAAVLGPIVCINIDEYRCDAIILQSVKDKPKLNHVHLSRASPQKIKNAHSIFLEALTGRNARWPPNLTPPQSDEMVSKQDLHFPIPINNDIDEIWDKDTPSEMGDDRGTKAIFHLRKMQRVLKMLWTDIVEPVFRTLGCLDIVCSMSPVDFGFFCFVCLFLIFLCRMRPSKRYYHTLHGAKQARFHFCLCMLQACMSMMTPPWMQEPINMQFRRTHRAYLCCSGARRI